jgi:hypothetical protein
VEGRQLQSDQLIWPKASASAPTVQMLSGKPALSTLIPAWPDPGRKGGFCFAPGAASRPVLDIFRTYLFLNLRSALSQIDPAMEDAARCLGYGPESVIVV